MDLSKATKKQLLEEIKRLQKELSSRDGDMKHSEGADERSPEPSPQYTLPPMDIEDGYFELDLEGNMLSCNEPIARILGYPRSEIIGMNALRPLLVSILR